MTTYWEAINDWLQLAINNHELLTLYVTYRLVKWSVYGKFQGWLLKTSIQREEDVNDDQIL